MAFALNETRTVGFLGEQAELDYHDGFTVLRFDVAVTSKWTTETGEKRTHTEWVPVVLKEQKRNGQANTQSVWLHSRLEKGTPVLVLGRFRTRSYTDSEGVRRKTAYVAAEDIQLLTRAPS